MLSGSAQLLLGGALVAYVAAVGFVGWLAARRVESVEDFVVAGRRLPLHLATATLIATWFCAGTLLTSTDEVRERGLEAAALDPWGAGFCLILVGLFFAGPLWRAKLTTLPDLFGRRFGPRAEVVAAVLGVPAYLGWVAQQFLAMGDVLAAFFPIAPLAGMLLVAAVGVAFTLVGGMWSVTLTDAMQLVLLVLGLVALLVAVASELGAGDAMLGLLRIPADVPPERLVLIPTDSVNALLVWTGAFLAGAAGNIPMQDVMQRVFSSRSERVARAACLIGGVVYIGLGLIPVTLGLAATLLLPSVDDGATIAVLARLFLHPAMTVVFALTLCSAVLSTITSGLLAPAVMLSQNVMPRLRWLRFSPLARSRLAVLIVAALCLATALSGDDAYTLLEDSYELGMVCLLVPLMGAIWLQRATEWGAMLSMLVGFGAWAVHYALGLEAFAGLDGIGLPVGVGCTALSAFCWLVGSRFGDTRAPALVA